MMTKFLLSSGATVYLNVHPTIPMGVVPDGKKTKLYHPTHNNGGYLVEETYTDVLAKIDSALDSYRVTITRAVGR